jgi:hypothetical protein
MEHVGPFCRVSGSGNGATGYRRIPVPRISGENPTAECWAAFGSVDHAQMTPDVPIAARRNAALGLVRSTSLPAHRSR